MLEALLISQHLCLFAGFMGKCGIICWLWGDPSFIECDGFISWEQSLPLQGAPRAILFVVKFEKNPPSLMYVH
ncbi:hypothetical protein RIF29_39886 [Crotalaria pallida]|uniref:Uncharacterized protein n=1 Tax=Crotalaria pallida TaxID=3830 RepID=A0AAN9HMX1_CROPI